MSKTRRYNKKRGGKKHKTKHRRKVHRRARKHRGGGCGCQTGGGAVCAPSPFVGRDWGPTYASWPGTQGSPNGYTEPNHFKVSPNGITGGLPNPPIPGNDVQFGSGLSGGNKRKRKTNHKKGGKRKNKTRKGRKQRGGGLIPQDLVNLGRGVGHGFYSLVNDFRGVSAPSSPSPTDQPIDQNYAYIGEGPPNIPKIIKDAGKSVAAI